MYSLVIVDDEAVLRDGLALRFPWEKYDFSVKAVFESPRRTLDFFGRDSADALITDIRMPFMSGLELIRNIKRDPRNNTVMCLLSAWRDFSYAQEGMALGVKYYLVKPAGFEEIGETFRKIKAELDSRVPGGEKIPETENDIIRRVFAIMKTRTASCSLFSIAEDLELDASYLSRLFKRETGEKFRDWLRKIKMEQAAAMLRSQVNYTNRDISEVLGYQDAQNFCRVFQKHFGMSPGQFRRKGEEE